MKLQKWRKGVLGPITGLARTRGVDRPVDMETFGLGIARLERTLVGKGDGSCIGRLRGGGLGRVVDEDDILW